MLETVLLYKIFKHLQIQINNSPVNNMSYHIINWRVNIKASAMTDLSDFIASKSLKSVMAEGFTSCKMLLFTDILTFKQVHSIIIIVQSGMV